MNEEHLAKLRERINKQFFCGLSIGELGSNQVDEEQLQSFIEKEVSAAYSLRRSEVRSEAIDSKVHCCEDSEEHQGISCDMYWRGKYKALEIEFAHRQEQHEGKIASLKAKWKKEVVERTKKKERYDPWLNGFNMDMTNGYNRCLDDITRIVEEI